MADDRITIDPEFAPPPSKEPGKGWAWLITAAVGVAAFVLGSLLGSPAPVEPAEIDSAATATTASDIEAPSTGTTIDSVVSTTPRVSSIREMVLLPMPLSEAVPGFTDTVVLLETPNPGLYVHRWRASERRTELALFVPRGSSWWPGLNASGTLFAQVSRGSLIVTQVSDTGMDPSESEWEGLDVDEVWWHETRPGALAFLSCPPSQPGVATFHSLDVSDPASRPLPLGSVDQGCGNEEQDVWVERWDNEGVWIGQAAPGDDTRIFIAADGSETAVDSGPPGAIETLQVDGEWEDFSYSPDGTLVALVVYDSSYTATATVRVVSSKSGEVVAEMTEPGSEVFASLTWSTDGRFLIFQQWNPDTGTARLVFYDTATNSTTTIPILDIVDEIRTAPAVATTSTSTTTTATSTSSEVSFTEVEWTIDLNDPDGEPGVASIFTIAEARPLTEAAIEDLFGFLVWDGETVVDLCNVEVRGVGSGYVQIGDGYATSEGCGDNRGAMQEAFELFGVPDIACVGVIANGRSYKYCGSLNEV